MAKQELDRPDIGAGFQEMDRETVPQYMWGVSGLVRRARRRAR